MGAAGKGSGRALRQAARLGDADAQFHLARLIAAGEVEAESAEQTVNGLLQAAAEAMAAERLAAENPTAQPETVPTA